MLIDEIEWKRNIVGGYEAWCIAPDGRHANLLRPSSNRRGEGAWPVIISYLTSGAHEQIIADDAFELAIAVAPFRPYRRRLPQE